ncbi:MAG: hypothetical protein AB1705_22610 [Verrucomicrobiota bacterium]
MRNLQGPHFWIGLTLHAVAFIMVAGHAVRSGNSAEGVETPANKTQLTIPAPPPGVATGEPYFDESKRLLVLPGQSRSGDTLASAGNTFFGLLLLFFGVCTGFISETAIWKAGGFGGAAMGLLMLSRTVTRRGVPAVVALDELPENQRKVWEQEAARLLAKQRAAQSSPKITS